jgi:hypothetical protein
MSLIGGAVMVNLGSRGPQTDRILGFLSVTIVGAWLGIGVGTIGIAFTNRSAQVAAIVGIALWILLTLCIGATFFPGESPKELISSDSSS